MSKETSGLFPDVPHGPDPELARSDDAAAETEVASGVDVLDRNISRLAERYPLTEYGYFGSSGNGDHVRVIYSDDPVGEAIEFFKVLSEGGIVSSKSNDRIELVDMPDGSIVSFRIESKSGGPAIGINNAENSRLNFIQKIHFVKKDGVGGSKK